MANYFYVKNGGTAAGTVADGSDGVYTSLQTGTFASLTDTFATIADAFNVAHTVSPVDGDFVIVSDEHVETSAHVNWFSITSPYGMIHVVSTDDGACQTYAAMQDSTGLITSTGVKQCDWVSFWGIKYTSNLNNGIATDVANTCSFWHNCDLTLTQDNDTMFDVYGNDGVTVMVSNSTLRAATGSNGGFVASIGQAGTFKMYNTNVEVDGTGSWDALLVGAGLVAGTRAFFEGCDLSPVPLAIPDATVSGDDLIHIEINNCKLHATFLPIVSDGDFLAPNQSILISGSDDTKADGYRFQNMYGTATSEYTTVRTDGDPMLVENADMSIKVVTTSDCSVSTPFILDYPTKVVDFATASTDSINVFVAGAAQLTDADVRVEVLYRNSTSNVDTTSTPSVTLDPLSAGTNLTDDSASSAWNGSPTYEQRISVTATSGIECVPIVRILIYKPSATMYLDTEFDIHAG